MVSTQGAVVLVILDGDLTLRVGAQVGERAALALPSHLLGLAANLGELYEQAVREVEREGHVVGGLVAGIAEHHALIAGTLTLGLLALDTAVDVGALLV